MVACSDYFRAMLTGLGNMKETRSDSVELKGVSALGLRVVVEFAYTGRINLSLQNLEEVRTKGCSPEKSCYSQREVGKKRICGCSICNSQSVISNPGTCCSNAFTNSRGRGAELQVHGVGHHNRELC